MLSFASLNLSVKSKIVIPTTLFVNGSNRINYPPSSSTHTAFFGLPKEAYNISEDS